MAVIVSNDLVLADATAAIPLSHPRILHDDIWRSTGATITASSQATGYEAANVADGLTWDNWQPTDLPAWVEVQTTAGEEVDYAFLAAHTIGSVAATVKPQYHNGTTWVDLADEVSPGSDSVLAFLFTQVIASRFRFYFAGANSPSLLPAIGIAMMGKATKMERGLTLNHMPITMAKKTVVRPQLSEGGQMLGRSIRREGVAANLAFTNLTAAWIHSTFLPFVEDARTYPFGWVWHPVDYSAEVALLWTTSQRPDIQPQHAGLPDRMNVSFDVEGIVE